MKRSTIFVILFLSLVLGEGVVQKVEDKVSQAKATVDKATTTIAGKKDELNSAADKVTSVLGKLSDTLDIVKDKATNVSQNLDAEKLASALKELRSSALARIDEVDTLLDQVSEAEKKVIEQGFTAIDKIIEEINKYTKMDITNEYEAAQVSEYVDAEIRQVESLVSDTRKFVNRFVDEATEKIHEVTPKVKDTAQTIADVAQKLSGDLAAIMNIIQNKKDEYNLNNSITDPTTNLLEFIGENTYPGANGQVIGDSATTGKKKVSFDDILTAARVIADGGSVASALATLPETKAVKKINDIVNTVNTGVALFETGRDIYEQVFKKK